MDSDLDLAPQAVSGVCKVYVALRSAGWVSWHRYGSADECTQSNTQCRIDVKIFRLLKVTLAV